MARAQAVTLAVQQFADAERLRVLLAAAPLAIVTGTTDGIVTSWNPAAERMFGWTAAEAVGRFLPYVADEDRSEFQALVAALSSDQKPVIVTRRRRRKDGSDLQLNLAVSPLLSSEGRMNGFLSFIEDATARVRVAQSDRAAARTDPLTGLLNRRGFQEVLALELQRADQSRQPIGFAMFDLDGFKAINDTHGHEAGDRVLRWAAQMLNETLRTTDFACRWGGEELLVMLPGAGIEVARQVATRVRVAIAATKLKEGLSVTISAGVAERSPGEAVEAAIARADASLYEAKAAGRNRVC